MIKVLNVVSNLNKAGTEAVVMNYIKNYDKNIITNDFLVLSEDEGYYEKEIKDLGGNIYKIPSFTKNFIKNLYLRKKFFKHNKYDIVEVHSPSTLRYGYLKEAKSNGIKTIFHLHNYNKNKNVRLMKYAAKNVEKYSDSIVTCSMEAAESFYLKNAELVCNAIDFDTYKFDKNKRDFLREKYGIKENEILIGHIGRFSKVKNQIFLINLMTELGKFNNFKLMFKGFGEDEEYLKKTVCDRKLEDRIIFADNSDTAIDLYNCFDLFVLPSLYEGLPVVTVEAQANQLEIICSDNVSKECNILSAVDFVELDKDKWIEKLTGKKFARKPITKEDFIKTGYEIKSAAKKRLEEYERLCNL